MDLFKRVGNFSSVIIFSLIVTFLLPSSYSCDFLYTHTACVVNEILNETGYWSQPNLFWNQHNNLFKIETNIVMNSNCCIFFLFLGTLYKSTGDYTCSLILCGSCVFVMGIILLLDPVLKRCQDRLTENHTNHDVVI